MNSVIIAAAGSASRMKAGMNKSLIPLCGKPMISYSLDLFEKSPDITEVIIVTRKEDFQAMEELALIYKTPIKVVEGGSSRQESVTRGLYAVTNTGKKSVVLIHNAANPLVKLAELKNVIDTAREHGAALLAQKAKDTIKQEDGKTFVTQTLDRKMIWHAQTPQALRYDVAKKAFEYAAKNNVIATDDVSLVETIKLSVKLVECSPYNFKITTPDDMRIAEVLIREFPDR